MPVINYVSDSGKFDQAGEPPKAARQPKQQDAARDWQNKPHHDQKSESGNDGHSGLPIKSDGSYRDSSDLTQPAKKK